VPTPAIFPTLTPTPQPLPTDKPTTKTVSGATLDKLIKDRGTTPTAAIREVVQLSDTLERAAEKIEEEQQDRMIQQEATRLAFNLLTQWFTNNVNYIGLGLLLYAIILSASSIFTGRFFSEAQNLREQATMSEEEVIADAEGKIVGEGEESGVERATKKRRERERFLLTKKAKGLERRGRIVKGIFSLTGTVLFLVYMTWVVVETEGLEILKSLGNEIIVQDIVGRLITIVFIIFAADLFRKIALFIMSNLVNRMQLSGGENESQKELRARTLTNVLSGAVTLTIIIYATILSLQTLGMKIGAILAGVGVAGLAIGFGAQSLVRDFIGGFYILLENQFRVGDLVEIAGNVGIVEQITLRSTRIRHHQTGVVYVVPNGEITTVANLSFLWSRHEANIGVSYNNDPNLVIEILNRIGHEMNHDPLWSERMLGEPQVLGLDDFADSALVFKVVFKTKSLEQFNVGREYKRRLYYAFKDAGVEIPFPHRTVYHRMEKQEKPLSFDIVQRPHDDPEHVDEEPTNSDG
jgi:small conductance mechanosensitive channel